MSDKDNLTVAGFSFISDEDAEFARQEAQKIIYLEKRINYKLPENTLAIYNKILGSKVMQTPVGWGYLHTMQVRMLSAGIEPELITPIPLYETFTHNPLNDDRAGVAKQRIKTRIKKEKSELRKYRERFQITVVIILILFSLVIGMFYIMLKGKNPNILNYEKVLLDKYSSWEQELGERERAVKEKERKLNKMIE